MDVAKETRVVTLADGRKVNNVPLAITQEQAEKRFKKESLLESVTTYPKRRKVILADGRSVSNIPASVTPEQIKERYGSPVAYEPATIPKEEKKEEKKEEEKEEEKEEIKGDTSTGTLRDTAESALVGFSTVGTPILTGVGDVIQAVSSEDNAAVKGIRKLVDENKEAARFIQTRTADSFYASTIAEAVPPMLAYVSMGGPIMRGLMAVGASGITSGVVSGIVTDQVLADREYNLSNLGMEIFTPEDEGTILEFLSASEDDTIAEQRLKLLAEGLIVGGVIGLFVDYPILNKIAKKVGGGVWDKLSNTKKVEGLLDYFKEIKTNLTPEQKDLITVFDPDTGTRRAVDPIDGMVPSTPDQIIQQQESSINRFIRQTFTSRGYWTPEAFNAFEGAEAAKRQLITRAEHIGNRLMKNIRSAAEAYDDQALGIEEITIKINKSFNEGLKFLEGSENRVKDFAEYFDLPEGVAKEVLAGREQIDELSRVLTDSNLVSDELKKIIQGNIGKYLRRSYQLFEDGQYSPTSEVRQEAEDYLVKNLRGKNPEMTLDEAALKARQLTDDILGGGEVDKTLTSYMQSVRRVNDDVLKRKDEAIPKEIRALMGEITDPAENLVLTITKMVDYSESVKFYDELITQANGKYIFDSSDNGRAGFTSVISGTNSKLDGMYTTPEMAKAISGRQGKLIDLLPGKDHPLVNKLFQNFFAMKGISQKLKTVYSHTTQLRNVFGGAQFNVANGLLPWGNNKETFALLKNQVLHGGDEALDAMYEEYLKFGLINTNVNVNEFRALIKEGEGYFADPEAWIARGAKWAGKIDPMLGKGVKGADKILKYAEDIYMATDDFFKINAYIKELEVLKRATPEVDINTLKQQAADIVRDTHPAYDLVPPAIKGLREMPIGTFVAYPAEIFRNSVKILGQARKEIMSGNDVLMKRGAQRLAGYTTSASVWGSVGALSAKILGLTDAETEAIDEITEVPWNSSEKTYMRDSDTGQLYINDSANVNSYAYVRELFADPIAEIQQGILQDDAWNEIVSNAAWRLAENALDPFISLSVNVKPVADVVAAKWDNAGKTPEGKTLFPNADSAADQVFTAVKEISSVFEPGSLKSVRNLLDTEEIDNASGLTVRDTGTELITNLGVKITKVDPVASLTRAFGKYSAESRNKGSLKVSYGDDPKELVASYIKLQREEYRLQRDLYKKIKAVGVLLGDSEARKILNEAGMSVEKVGSISRGKFVPQAVSDDKIRQIRDKVYTSGSSITPADSESRKNIQKEFYALYRTMRRTSLESFADEKDADTGEYSEGARILRASGGVVDIPQTKDRPEERIDPYTGQPYAETASGDPLARLGFSWGGGVIKKIAPQIKKFFKGVDAPTAEAKALDSLAGKPLTKDELDLPITLSFMNSNKSISKQRRDIIGTYDMGHKHEIIPVNSAEGQAALKEFGLEPEGNFMVIENRTLQSQGKSEVERNPPKFYESKEDLMMLYNSDIKPYFIKRGDDMSWRTTDDVDAYGLVLPQGRAAKENMLDEIDPELATTILDMGLLQSPEQIANFKYAIENNLLDVAELKARIHPITKSSKLEVQNIPSKSKTITVYHGSAADFDEFSLDFIGTGEGAQAFGHGLYFTDTKGVASGYRKDVTLAVKRREFLEQLPEDADIDDITEIAGKGGFTDEMNELIEALAEDDWLGFDYPAQAINAAFRELDAFDASPRLKKAINTGNLYEVDLDITPDELLDYDGLIKDQPLGNNEWIQNWIQTSFHEPQIPKLRGVDVLNSLAEGLKESANASAVLSKLGIKGIKYLAGASRKKGSGNYNYVIFDPKDVKPVKKNNQRITLRKFIEESDHQEVVYRATTSDEPISDLLQGLENPRQVGLHVGANPDQANTIINRNLVAGKADGQLKTITPQERDEVFGAMSDEAFNPEGSAPKAAISEYYIDIRSPLKMKNDLGIWDAEEIVPQMMQARLPDDYVANADDVLDALKGYDYSKKFGTYDADSKKLVDDYVRAFIDEEDELLDDLAFQLEMDDIDIDNLEEVIESVMTPEGSLPDRTGFVDAIEEQMGRPITSKEWDALEETMNIELQAESTSELMGDQSAEDFAVRLFTSGRKYDSNRKFRSWLESLGFDSIEYKNTGEASTKGADTRSWILFHSKQIKTKNNLTFDVTDPRVNKALGGLVRMRTKYKKGGEVDLLNKVKEELKQDEGVKNEIYIDKLGVLTGGVGSAILDTTHPWYGKKEGEKLDPKEVEHQFDKDIKQAYQDAKEIIPNFENLPEAAKEVVVNMSFQLGKTKLSEFKKFIGHVENNFWKGASKEMILSKWYRQTPERARKHSNKIRDLARVGKAEGGMVDIPKPPNVMLPQAQVITNPTINQDIGIAGSNQADPLRQRGLMLQALKRRFQ